MNPAPHPLIPSPISAPQREFPISSGCALHLVLDHHPVSSGHALTGNRRLILQPPPPPEVSISNPHRTTPVKELSLIQCVPILNGENCVNSTVLLV
jgi:hypothetical protein